MTQLQDELTVGEIKKILKLFENLQKALQPKTIKKNEDLERKAYKEAEEELIVELEEQQKRFTTPPGKPNIIPKKASKLEQKKFQEQVDRNIRLRAKKKYRTMDKRYDDKLKEKEDFIQLLIQKIDHTITPLSVKFKRCYEANNTLLTTNWAELRKIISWQDFTTREVQEQINRTIVALKILRDRVKRKKTKYLSLIKAAKWIYGVTIKAFWDSLLEFLSKSQGNK